MSVDNNDDAHEQQDSKNFEGVDGEESQCVVGTAAAGSLGEIDNSISGSVAVDGSPIEAVAVGFRR